MQQKGWWSVDGFGEGMSVRYVWMGRVPVCIITSIGICV